MRKLLPKFLQAILIFSFSTHAFSMGMDDFETPHSLTIGGGISSPSGMNAIRENPAGLIFNQQFKLLGEVASGSNSITPLAAGGALYLGNGFVGGGLGFDMFNNYSGSAGSVGVFNLGLAAFVPSINTAFGVSGSYTIWNNGGVGITSNLPWGLNVGAIFNPNGAVRAGATAFQLLSNFNTIGLGVAADPTSWATFSLDATKNLNGAGTTLLPAIGIHLLAVQLEYGYAFSLENGNSWMPLASEIGINVRLNQTFQLEAYYNKIALYYVGLSARF